MPKAGRTYEIDDAWRSRVTAEMADQGLGRSELARRLGAIIGKTSKSAITELLEGKTNSRGERVKQSKSTLVAAIHQVLGWAPPPTLTLTDDELALLDVYRALSVEDQQIVTRDAVRRLAPKSNPEAAARDALIVQAADAVIEAAVGQTDTVLSSSEGSPRSPRTRRASRGR